MPRQVALLRGVNLARQRRLAMSDLRAVVEGLGYADVATHLQSGNVLLSSRHSPERVGRTISKGLADDLGFPCEVIVRTAVEMVAVVEGNPIPEATEGSRLLVTFLGREPAAGAVEGLEDEDLGGDRIRVRGREIYSWCPGGFNKSAARAALDARDLGVSSTARNMNTVRRLAEMLAAPPG
jgi:uncharacterized protein (DUF1697 family)